ncbi:MAG: hypothetical protein ACPGJS_20900 [Flammeovirgaceae bacterium]
MRKRLFQVITVILATSITLLLLEFGVRIIAPQSLVATQSDIAWRTDDTFGWNHQANVNTQINLAAAEVAFATDAYGYRINSTPVHYPENAKNVLVLGDSFLEAAQVENEESTVEVLRLALEKEGISSRFYNTAVSGWDPNHYFLAAKQALEEHQLTIDYGLVFLYIGNDIINEIKNRYQPKKKFKTHHFHIPKKWNSKGIKKAFLYPINDFFEQRSHLFIFIKKKNYNLLGKLGLGTYYFPEVFKKDFKDSENWQTTYEVCRKIRHLFLSKNIPVDFVLIPTSYQVNEEQFREYQQYFNIDVNTIALDQPNQILSEKFATDSVLLLDPLEFFRAEAKQGNRLYGTIDKHFIPLGHQKMAEYLLPTVQTALSVRDTTASPN